MVAISTKLNIFRVKTFDSGLLMLDATRYNICWGFGRFFNDPCLLLCMQKEAAPKTNSYSTYHTASMLCSTLIIIIIKKYSARQSITIQHHVTINLIYGYTALLAACNVVFRFSHNRQYSVALYRTPYGAWVHCFWSRWDPCVHLMKLADIFHLKLDGLSTDSLIFFGW